MLPRKSQALLLHQPLTSVKTPRKTKRKKQQDQLNDNLSEVIRTLFRLTKVTEKFIDTS